MVFDEEIEKRHRIRSNVRYVGHCPLREMQQQSIF